MNYTINQLRIFLKVAQLQSVTKAAEDLHLTQPAVSIQLKNFQDQFDIALTEIIGRKLFVTDFGKEIALAAENILNEVGAINNKTLSYKGQLVGKLKISVVSTGKYVMPYFLVDFLQQNKGVDLIMDVTNKQQVLQSLEKNEVDYSLVSVLPETLRVEKLKLLQNKLYVITNASTTYPKTIYNKNILQNLPFIYREVGSGTRLIMEKFIMKNNLPIVKKMELTSNEAVKQAVVAGFGCSIMPLIGIKNELQNGDLQIIPVKDFPIKSDWNLIWLKGKNHSPVASALLNFIKKEKINIINDKFKWYEQY